MLTFGAKTLTIALPRPVDSYFTIAETEPLVLGDLWFVVSTARHDKDASFGFGQLHRIDDAGKVLWTVTPDPLVEGMGVVRTTTGLLVIGAWAGDPPALVARLLDPASGEVLASHPTDTWRVRELTFASERSNDPGALPIAFGAPVG